MAVWGMSLRFDRQMDSPVRRPLAAGREAIFDLATVSSSVFIFEAAMVEVSVLEVTEERLLEPLEVLQGPPGR